MRLLYHRNGDYHLTGNLLDNQIPPYAILSHTWGNDTEEVTFEDVVEGSGRDKAGFKKIIFCGEQAAADGLQHFWVDSCCIKKTSDAELSESLNSMYKWYQRAAKCYVYLADVSVPYQANQWNWEQAFRGSRWFYRGWTLQELLAPYTVEFFSREGTLLGNKSNLKYLIQEITRIDVRALQGTHLSQFEVDKRFSWQETRSTTRGEDIAYSLLGIFDVSMSVIYGEGRERAISRLRKEVNGASNGNRGKTPQLHTFSSMSGRRWTALRTLKISGGFTDCVALSPDGGALASNKVDTVLLWDSGSGEELHTLKGHTEDVNDVAFSPDGKILASASTDYTVKIWNSELGVKLGTYRGHKDDVRAVTFSQGGTMLASASNDKTIRLWDSRSRAALHTLEGHTEDVNDVAFSPDGKTLASASYDCTVKLWDYRSPGVGLYTSEDQVDIVNSVAFSPDGKTLASASGDCTIRLWDVKSGIARCTLEGHEGSVWKVAFSPDGKTLASVSFDSTIRIWEARSGAMLQTLHDANWSLAFSSDGNMLVSLGRNSTVRIWEQTW